MRDVNHIICHSSITYANGAKVNTSFITNLDDDGTVVESGWELSELINAKDDELQGATKRSLPKYEYPEAVLTAAKVNWFAAHHTAYRLHRDDCVPIARLDAQGDKGIFGGGLLLSEAAAERRAAAEREAGERAAAERQAKELAQAGRMVVLRDGAIRWVLSEREREMQRMIGGRGGARAD